MKVKLVSCLQLDHGSRVMGAGSRMKCQSFVPMGLLMVAAALRKAGLGLEVEILELGHAVNTARLRPESGFYEGTAEMALEGEPDVLGFMTDTDSYHHTLLAVAEIKRRRPDVAVVFGGTQASATAERTLKVFPGVDIVVRGEAEVSAPLLMAALRDRGDLATVPGIAFRRDGAVISTPEAPLVDDLDLLPLPAYDLYAYRGDESFYMEVGRGCPYNCSFCSTAPYWRHKFRVKSPERIIGEIRLVKELYGVTRFNFIHDIFTYDHAWVLRLCAALEEAALGIEWTCSSRTDTMTPELVERMARAGAVAVYYGIESGSEQIQRKMGKRLDIGAARRIISHTAATERCAPIAGLIIGFPFETEATAAETIALWFELLRGKVALAHLFSLCPFAGSKMQKAHLADARFHRDFEDLDVPAHTRLTIEKMMLEHPDLFSGCYRYRGGVEGNVIAEADGFSLLVNTARAISIHFAALYRSPYEFFKRWAEWATARKAARGSRSCTMDDYFDFLEEQLTAIKEPPPGLNALLSYERMKLQMERRLLAERGEGPLPREGFRNSAFTAMLELDEDPTALITGGKGAAGPVTAVFYRDAKGTLKSMKVGTLVRDILAITEKASTYDEIELELGCAAPAEKLREVLRRLVVERVIVAAENEETFQYAEESHDER